MNQYQNQTNQNMNNSYQRQAFSNPGLNMATAAMLLGLGALFTVFTVFMPLLLGGLAVLFALLSKGYNPKMLTQAKVGAGCGIAGIVVVVFMFIGTYAVLFSNPDMLIEIGKEYDATYEELYGQDTEDIFGFSFEDMMEDYADMLD